MFLIVSLFVLGTVAGNTVFKGREYVKQNTTDAKIEYVLLNEDNPCARTCIEGAESMVCQYHFDIEWYDTLSKACYDCPLITSDCFRQDCIPGDGYKRAVVSINRQIPGPMIEVCQGDTIVADITNELSSEGTAFHWHGQHVKDTPYMDGVPYVTQCPIAPHNTFRYIFKAEQAGTHFWHSHIGMQRADGAYGALIVRIPEEQNPHARLYDYDLASHVMTVIDWERETGLEKFLAHHHNDGDNKPTTLLINGLGRFKEFTDEDNNTVYTPTARFKVEKGFRYRFRVINAGFLNCPVEISVDNHTISVISTDGNDIAPRNATSLVTYAGERFDFVLNADQEPKLYWIRYRGLMDCDERFKRAHQVAVLEYDGLNTTMDDYPDEVVDYESSHRDGTQINALNRGVESNATYVSMPQLECLKEWDETLKAKPDIQYYIAYDFYEIDNPHYHKSPYYGFENISDVNLRLLTPQFNHISMKTPSFPLLSQRNEITENMFCNKDTINQTECLENYCECPHGIVVPLNSVVELIFVDEGSAYDANHPLHMHGHSFRIVAMERLGPNVTVEQVKKRDEEGLIQRNLLDAPLKDTVTVPDGGYTIVRLHATNPGYWIFHCHIEFHADVGMAMVFKVGEDDDMVPVPKNFPTCGDYIPSIESVKEESAAVCQSGSLVNKFTQLFGQECSKAPEVGIFGHYVAALLALIGFVR